MTNPPLISNKIARRTLLSKQGLCRPPKKKLTADKLQSLVEELGFVQVDSVSTVERAHHMILFARNETYRPSLLARLLEEERSLFENWTHDASIIPSRFFPYWRPRFRRDMDRLKKRWRKWHGKEFESFMDGVLTQIRENGPMRARDLHEPKQAKAGGWWDWHPAKTALEFLWRTGALAVARREGFQKVYDLTERVLSRKHLESDPPFEDFRDWKCREALNRLGIATPGEIAAFWDSLSPKEASLWCRDKLASGEIIEVGVEALDGRAPRKCFCRSEFLDDMNEMEQAPPRIRALSPFDPVVRDRKRLNRLFGFDYRIEIFVPEAKRQYGYYVFPLLEGESFIGRLEMRHSKPDDALCVEALWPERTIKWGKTRQNALEAELERHRRYLKAGKVIYNGNWLRSPL